MGEGTLHQAWWPEVSPQNQHDRKRESSLKMSSDFHTRTMACFYTHTHTHVQVQIYTMYIHKNLILYINKNLIYTKINTCSILGTQLQGPSLNKEQSPDWRDTILGSSFAEAKLIVPRSACLIVHWRSEQGWHSPWLSPALHPTEATGVVPVETTANIAGFHYSTHRVSMEHAQMWSSLDSGL